MKSNEQVAETLALIRRILLEELDIDRCVEPQHRLLQDLELDSLQLLTLAVAIEDHYRIKLRETDARDLTVEALALLVCRRRNDALEAAAPIAMDGSKAEDGS